MTLQDGSFGLFDDSDDTQNYISLGNADGWYTIIHDRLSELEQQLILSARKRVEKRKAYTILELLGDFGGFNDAIFLIFSLPMSIYSAAMYN